MAAVVLTVDLVVLGHDGADWRVLLITRRRDPFLGRWALPGGKVEATEDAAAAAAREVLEETGLHLDQSELIPVSWHTRPRRDPRGRYVSLVYAVVLPDTPEVEGGDDAEAAWWQPLPPSPLRFLSPAQRQKFAFDHAALLRQTLLLAPRTRAATADVRTTTPADIRDILRLSGTTIADDAAAAANPVRGHSAVASLGGFVVGYAGPGSGPEAAPDVVVHPRWQGCGIAERLADFQRNHR